VVFVRGARTPFVTSGGEFNDYMAYMAAASGTVDLSRDELAHAEVIKDELARLPLSQECIHGSLGMLDWKGVSK